jgi:hypothetical protein
MNPRPPRQPPRLANWVLDRFGVAASNEGLMGDLTEEYASGRSGLWYWKQTMAAVIVTVSRTVRREPLLVIRALVVECLYFFLATQAFYKPTAYWLWSKWGRTYWPAVWALGLLICGLGGWVVARTDRAHAAAMVSLCWAIGWGASLVWLLYLHFQTPSHPSASDIALNSINQLAFLACGLLSAGVPPAVRRTH